ncbi:DUF3828 domain-containing protein [Citrobacter amalonaticus]|nr:DUF3828 domain-containing protein [Citrobacter amalonaticus]
MMVTATGIQIINSTACTLAQPGVKPGLLINSTDGTEMKKIIITGLLISSSTFASVSPTGPEATALKFNHWYIAQLLLGREPLTDYRGLEPYVTANTIAALKASNSADPETEDVPDADMFIKAQDFFDDWRQITVVSSDFDPVCYQVYVSFGVKQKHTVIDCMVKENDVWKVQSVAGHEILRNVNLK